MNDSDHALNQRVESHLRRIDRRGSVAAALAMADDAHAHIAATFEGSPELVIIYQGVARGMTQQAIADELAARGLPLASNQRVSDAEAALHRAHFLKRRPKGPGYVIGEEWDEFDLPRTLKKLLKKRHVDPLP